MSHPWPFYDHYKEQFLHRYHTSRCTGIQAPTGSGKSTSVYRLVLEHPSLFKRTLFILPTHDAIQSIKTFYTTHHPHRPMSPQQKTFPVHLMTPKTALLHLLKYSYSTIVIDEVHLQSDFYEALLRGVKYIRCRQPNVRILLLSATLPMIRLQSFFPDIIVEDLTSTLTSPFPVTIVYRDHVRSFTSPNFFTISNEIVHLFEETIPYTVDEPCKILCFVATHDQCEKIATMIQKVCVDTCRDAYHVITLHGGMEEDEIATVYDTFRTVSHVFCVATNKVETGVTIEGINIIVDSGLQCRVEYNKVQTVYCDQMAMIQRSGRTGRTCSGTVYRIMSEAFYNALPYQVEVNVNLEHVVIALIHHQLNPMTYLGSHDCQTIVDRMIALDMVTWSTSALRSPVLVWTDGSMGTFLDMSHLGMKNGSFLFHFVRQDIVQQPSYWLSCEGGFRYLGILLTVACIHMYDSRMMHICYFPMISNANRIRHKLTRYFSPWVNDKLLFVLHVFLTVFLSDSPKEVARYFSLNFKSFRELSRVVKKVCILTGSLFQSSPTLQSWNPFAQHSLPPEKSVWFLRDASSWVDAYKTVRMRTSSSSTNESESSISEVRIANVRIPQEVITTIRHVLVKRSPYICQREFCDTVCHPSGGVHHFIRDGFCAPSPSLLTALCLSSHTNSSNDRIWTLWTLSVWDYRDDLHVFIKHWKRLSTQRQLRDEQKTLFSTTVITEIHQDVAHRPYGYQCIQRLESWLRLIV